MKKLQILRIDALLLIILIIPVSGLITVLNEKNKSEPYYFFYNEIGEKITNSDGWYYYISFPNYALSEMPYDMSCFFLFFGE